MKMHFKISLKDNTYRRYWGAGQNVSKLGLSKTTCTTTFVFEGQIYKVSDKIKTPKCSIYCLFDTYYSWLHSVCDQKPVFTQILQ